RTRFGRRGGTGRRGFRRDRGRDQAGRAVAFARSLPLAKAQAPEVLLAYQMNGVDLPPAHGFPLRAVVPGWYGVASIKWLRRLVVTSRPFKGFFQTFDYSYFTPFKGVPEVRPITDLEVKAQLARPA